MSLIRCEWCGMSYDGGRHENCPHCNAPRPAGATPDEESTSVESRTDALNREADAFCTVFYSDNVPYYVSSNDGCGIESDVAEDATSLNDPGGLMSDVHEEPHVIDSNDVISLCVGIPIALLLYFAFVLLMCMISGR